MDVQVQFLDSASEFKPPPRDTRGVLVIVLENHREDLVAIKAQVPGGHRDDGQ